MKKILLLIPLFILIVGCTHPTTNPAIESIIEEQSNQIIGIHYPVTGIQKLDQTIEKYVKNIQTEFKQKHSSKLTLKDPAELNIDYEYWIIGKQYYNIVLTTFVTSPSMAHPIHEIKTFVYDADQQIFLNLDHIITPNWGNLKKILIENHKSCIFPQQLDLILNNDNVNNIKFTFTNHSITLYFNPYEIANGSCGIIKQEIPYSNFSIPIIEEETTQNTFEYQYKERNLSITKPTIALTFDDGPSKYTNDIIELLHEYDANATFFILGNKVEIYQDTLRKSLQYGNELGNHSYNHKSLTKLSLEELKEQIDTTNEIVKKTLDYEIRFLRPTYGAINQKLRKETNMEIVLWNVDTQDWKLRNSKKIAEKALHDIKDGKTILMHDIYKSTFESLKIILPELKKQGYQIVTVSELKEIQKLRNETKNG